MDLKNKNSTIEANKQQLNDAQPLRFIIAGGGTGGHIFPAIAIANAIKESMPTATFLFVGANGKMEMEKVPQAGFDIKGIDIAGFNRSSILKNIGLPLKIIKSFFQVRTIFKNYTPDAVIGVGGYSTFPVLRFAQSKNIPTFIHESNSFAGKSNILLGKNATKIFVANAGMDKFFAAQKIVITGNPIRSSIENNIKTKEEGCAFFNLDATKKTILSIGGSLGAKSINETIANNIATFDKENVQLIWQTGKPYSSQAKSISANNKNIYTSDFIKEMEYAFAAADVVISRAGAMAVAEICTLGKPSVLVPYPFAAENHQTANATYLVQNNAALLVKDDKVAAELLEKTITLLYNDTMQNDFKSNSKKLVKSNVDNAIATEILNTLKKIQGNK
jgi:UDP-N-acetylglucosamine--N-acetylmuramyl-(pentapeptide) pyrophosphoryl-undecaprenol N-acetylglucosamine transferase